MYGERGGYMDLDGERYRIRAKINTIGCYSTQADQKALLGFVTRMCNWPIQVRFVHDETSARHELGKRIKAFYRLARRNLELLIPSGSNDA